MNLAGKTVRASFMHAPKCGALDMSNDALIEIDKAGTIAAVVRTDDASYERLRATARDNGNYVELPKHTRLLPGLVDLHIHAPQWPQLGKALDKPLEVWLQEYTFPLEARYADLAVAQPIYEGLVSALLANGTTTAVYFATIHDAASRFLAQTCLDQGQRAFVGKVVMDEASQCPDYYRDPSTELALQETDRFVEFVRSMPGNAAGLVAPIITPRFIPSCTDKALAGLGELAGKHDCRVQTHCSESDWEHNYVIERTGRTDAQALKDFGLLREHTVLAHSNFLTDTDMDLVRDTGAGVAHCPLSNVYFSNAVFPLRKALEKSLRVGLGTDISGGPSPSILESCRQAIASSRQLEEGVDPALPSNERRREHSRIDFREAFHLATAGGADVLGLPVGRFEPGCQFDAVLIDPKAPGAAINIDDDLDAEEDQAQKIITLASRANIASVWTQGRCVSGSVAG